MKRGKRQVGPSKLSNAQFYLIVLGIALAFTLLGGVVLQLNAGKYYLRGLQVNENIGVDNNIITEMHWSGLKSGTIHTGAGKTTYHQFLAFRDTSDPIEGCAIVFEQNEENVAADYLKCERGDDIFEYKLVFDNGLESEIRNNDLRNLDGERVNILGQEFTITQATKKGNTIKINMFGGPIVENIYEGEIKVFVIEGKKYSVIPAIITEGTGGTDPEVRFEINGEMTPPMDKNKGFVLKDGRRIGILNILPNEAGDGRDIVQLVFGATRVRFIDNDVTDSDFSLGVRVDGEDIEDARVLISARENDDEVVIDSIRYRLAADATKGDVYIPKGLGLRSQLNEPGGMLSSAWDLRYEGLSGAVSNSPGPSIIKFDAGSHRYRLFFTNLYGRRYNSVPFLDASDSFKYGSDDDNFVFTEASDASDFNIEVGDYFVLSNRNDGKGQTHIMRYAAVDASGESVTFEDVSGSTKKINLFSITGNVVHEEPGMIVVPVTGFATMEEIDKKLPHICLAGSYQEESHCEQTCRHSHQMCMPELEYAASQTSEHSEAELEHARMCWRCTDVCDSGRFLRDDNCGNACAYNEECVKKSDTGPCYACEKPEEPKTCEDYGAFDKKGCKKLCDIAPYSKCIPKKGIDVKGCYTCTQTCLRGEFSDDKTCDNTCTENQECIGTKSVINGMCYSCKDKEAETRSTESCEDLGLHETQETCESNCGQSAYHCNPITKTINNQEKTCYECEKICYHDEYAKDNTCRNKCRSSEECTLRPESLDRECYYCEFKTKTCEDYNAYETDDAKTCEERCTQSNKICFPRVIPDNFNYATGQTETLICIGCLQTCMFGEHSNDPNCDGKCKGNQDCVGKDSDVTGKCYTCQDKPKRTCPDFGLYQPSACMANCPQGGNMGCVAVEKTIQNDAGEEEKITCGQCRRVCGNNQYAHDRNCANSCSENQECKLVSENEETGKCYACKDDPARRSQETSTKKDEQPTTPMTYRERNLQRRMAKLGRQQPQPTPVKPYSNPQANPQPDPNPQANTDPGEEDQPMEAHAEPEQDMEAHAEPESNPQANTAPETNPQANTQTESTVLLKRTTAEELQMAKKRKSMIASIGGFFRFITGRLVDEQAQENQEGALLGTIDGVPVYQGQVGDIETYELDEEDEIESTHGDALLPPPHIPEGLTLEPMQDFEPELSKEPRLTYEGEDGARIDYTHGEAKPSSGGRAADYPPCPDDCMEEAKKVTQHCIDIGRRTVEFCVKIGKSYLKECEERCPESVIKPPAETPRGGGRAADYPKEEKPIPPQDPCLEPCARISKEHMERCMAEGVSEPTCAKEAVEVYNKCKDYCDKTGIPKEFLPEPVIIEETVSEEIETDNEQGVIIGPYGDEIESTHGDALLPTPPIPEEPTPEPLEPTLPEQPHEFITGPYGDEIDITHGDALPSPIIAPSPPVVSPIPLPEPIPIPDPLKPTPIDTPVPSKELPSPQVLVDQGKDAGLTVGLKATDITNVHDLTIQKDHAKVVFEQPLDATNLNIEEHVVVQDERIEVKAEEVPEIKNIPATLTFYTKKSNPYIKVDGQTCHDCKIISHNRNTGELVVEVPHFSVFTVAENVSLGKGTLVVGGNDYVFTVSEDSPYKIAVDQNGDGDFDGDEVKITVLGNGVLDLGAIGGSSMAATLTTAKRYLDDADNDEVTTITFTNDGGKLSVDVSGANLSMEDVKGLDIEQGVTPYGTMFTLEEGTRNDLTIGYPSRGQQGGMVMLIDMNAQNNLADPNLS